VTTIPGIPGDENAGKAKVRKEVDREAEKLAKLKGHVLSNPVRLGIMVYLLSRGIVSFTSLQRVLDLTPGNLDSHVRTLEREGYVRVKKVISGRPKTAIVLTELGAEETEKYLRELRKLLETLEDFEL